MDMVATPWTEAGFKSWSISRPARIWKRLSRDDKISDIDSFKTPRHTLHTPCVGQFLYWSRSDPPSTTDLYSCMNGTNAGLAKYTAEMKNIRTCSTLFDYSSHGFQVIEHPLPTTLDKLDYLDESKVATHYWPDLVSLIKDQLGVHVVAVINHAVRRSSKAARSNLNPVTIHQAPSTDHSHLTSEPFHLAHNDCSAAGARNLLRGVLPSFFEDLKSNTAISAEDQQAFFDLRLEILNAEDDAVRATGSQSLSLWDGTRYRGPRWAILSVWQPLETVESDPIAILDPTSMFTLPSTVNEKHRAYASAPVNFSCRRGFADYQGDCVIPRLPRAEQHRWYWLPEQRSNEVLLIKLFDSEAWQEGSRVVPFATHSAFSLPNQSSSKPRFSIETRVFVVW